LVRRPRGGVSAAAMPAYAAPRDIGAVAVWDDGAEAPRARREDEVTEAGADPSTYNLFVVCAAIGVSSLPSCARVNLCLAPCSD
jgi:hypothetical protein